MHNHAGGAPPFLHLLLTFFLPFLLFDNEVPELLVNAPPFLCFSFSHYYLIILQ
jgi:hypothetical protein